MNSGDKIAALTSLRFFAASCIVLGHGGSKSFFNYSVDLFDLRQAVSFFFVLSGFILSHAYRNLNYRTGFRAFMAARISRLWPAYVVTALLAIATTSPIQSLDGAIIAIANILMLQSWVPFSEWHYSLNSVSWSISTEMFFYFVFPFVLAVALSKRSTWLWICAVLCLGVMLAIATALNVSPVEGRGITAWGLLYVFPLTRLTEFLIGMWAYRFALVLHEQSSVWSPVKAGLIELTAVAGVIGMVVLCSWLGKGVLLDIAPQSSVWVQTAGGGGAFAFLIAVLYRERGIVSRALRTRSLVYLGEISFALYLLHQIVIRWLFMSHRVEVEADLSFAYGLYWVISLIGAAAIYHFVEKPLRWPLQCMLEGQANKVIRI